MNQNDILSKIEKLIGDANKWPEIKYENTNSISGYIYGHSEKLKGISA